MSLQHLNFEAISVGDLSRLVADAIGESKTLEYKEQFVVSTEDQKREFLSDVTALANTDGGDLVFGMKESDGVAVELVGLKNLTPDEAIARIENLLRDSIQPRLAGVQLRALQLSNGNYVLLVRTPRSFSTPHMVRHHGVTRFCGRNANGKYDLDVHELRSAFLASETLSERIRGFRVERINRLLSGNAPVELLGDHLLVLHLLPVIGARADTRLATSSLQALLTENIPRPIAASSWDPRFNFDGLLVSSGWRTNKSHSYVQISRTGFLEAVESQTLVPTASQILDGELRRIIPGIAWEKRIVAAMPSYLKALAELKLPPPYVMSLSLLNVRGYIMDVSPFYRGNGGRPVDRDHLLTDEMLIESVNMTPGRLLRPLFDQIWNGCGWHGSINYDEVGNWKEHH
ncbi:MAG: ATP-binding protein [Opitutaceae bacterium]|nr:ATP-binding protein [Opitutaceae bacterium]